MTYLIEKEADPRRLAGQTQRGGVHESQQENFVYEDFPIETAETEELDWAI